MKNLILIVLVFFNTNLYSYAVNVDSLIQRLIGIDDNIVKVDLLNRIASEYTPVNYDKSIYFGNEALVLSRKINYSEGISNSLDNISYSHYYRSNYLKAMENYLLKVEIDDSLGLQDRVANSYIQIGNIYYYMKDYTRALTYYDKCLVIYEKSQDDMGIANTYTNMGNIYESKKEIQKAEQFYFMGLDIFRKRNDIAGIAITYNNLGNIYYKHYKSGTALEYFVKARNYLPKIDDMTIHVLVYNNYGDYHLWLNNNDSATYYLNRGFIAAEKHSIPLYKCDIASSLGIIYAKKRDFENAYKYQSISKHLNDSLFNSRLLGEMAIQEYQHKLEKTENLKIIEFLKEQRKVKTRLWIIILMIILSIAMGIISIIYHKGRMKNMQLSKEKLNLEANRLQEQLDFRNKEIVIITMNLFERNELIRHVIQKLQIVNTTLKRPNYIPIEEIIQDLKGQYHENILSEFEYRFQQVHTDFYKNLSEKHPDLTSNDLRLCAFLRMNMNTKDIVTLTHQTINSIEVARSRLRKKLNIKYPDIDLVMYLSQY